MDATSLVAISLLASRPMVMIDLLSEKELPARGPVRNLIEPPTGVVFCGVSFMYALPHSTLSCRRTRIILQLITHYIAEQYIWQVLLVNRFAWHLSEKPGHPQGDVPTLDRRTWRARIGTSPCGCPGPFMKRY